MLTWRKLYLIWPIGNYIEIDWKEIVCVAEKLYPVCSCRKIISGSVYVVLIETKDNQTIIYYVKYK